MITLDPRSPPADAGVVRDVFCPCLVTVRDPAGEHPWFSTPRLAAQLRVQRQGGMVLQHILQLAGGTEMRAPPAWVTECPAGVVIPLRPVEGLVRGRPRADAVRTA